MCAVVSKAVMSKNGEKKEENIVVRVFGYSDHPHLFNGGWTEIHEVQGQPFKQTIAVKGWKSSSGWTQAAHPTPPPPHKHTTLICSSILLTSDSLMTPEGLGVTSTGC